MKLGLMVALALTGCASGDVLYPTFVEDAAPCNDFPSATDCQVYPPICADGGADYHCEE